MDQAKHHVQDSIDLALKFPRPVFHEEVHRSESDNLAYLTHGQMYQAKHEYYLIQFEFELEPMDHFQEIV